jgi:hypothetical protein
MLQVAVLLAATSLGVDWGVQRQDDGQLEYVIQIEPALLDALKRGESITSRVDPRVIDVRRFRIQVGTGELPRDLPVAANESEPTSPEGYSHQAPNLLPLETEDSFVEADVLEARFERSTPDDRSDWTRPPSEAIDRMTEDPGASYADEFDGQGIDQVDMGALSPQEDRPAPQYDPGADSGQPLDAPPAFDMAAPQFDPPRKDVLVPPIEDYTPDTGMPSASQFANRESSLEPNRAIARALSAASTPDVPSDASRQPSQSSSGTVTSSTKVTQPTPFESASPTPSTRPWLPFMVTVLALFASVGLNVYLGWIAWDTYSRYHELVTDVNHAGSGAVI